MLEASIVEQIKRKTNVANRDNITRTEAYEQYYFKHTEIHWSLLAGFVSRNAGWNMCDLEGDYFPKVLSAVARRRIFLLYERANWLIFSDAYPQLLIYEYSREMGRPYFSLFHHFHISKFMEKEWMLFWNEGDKERLVKSLVMNEQFLIQKPIIEDDYFREKVFHSIHYRLQELFQFSFVIFPTRQGQLYGNGLKRFENVNERIKLGYGLYKLLFYPLRIEAFLTFLKEVPHTASRWDYEVFLPLKKKKDTPMLRETYPVIPHRRTKQIVGIDGVKNQNDYLSIIPGTCLEDQREYFLLKQQQMRLFISLQTMFS